ncbi:TonB-dependent siderophore receptor [Pectobacterium carotovorum]|uniref:TonB-dependent siderophore receptor n=1 Tax=Pectobacterium carotovorum TaxID=554 RepID=UPI0015DF49A7|nr:TonB-dependent siderophore receptor [Pectobacterium carotovorum]MBA0174129.1 TonB-dependent siderophore receptor [Pectobacterium carotovorum]MBB1529003.1 TonB-dependent siderophore receptor [Pectobacterium carotovorum subsp. carotovorum]MCA6966712.1 TonB-dependent siderophore receptor [Pectobacterium carotovorum]MCH4989137.1 TonB-dependent siderophore receptor [Pectobacterium carotovorum]
MNKFAIEKTTLRHGWPLLALLPFSIQAAIVDNKTVDGKEDTMVVSATTGAQAGKETGYQPHKTVTGTRTESRLLDVPQAVNVVPTQVLEDRAVRNIDEALYNVSGITQSNTLGGTQDAIIKRGFGDNRDGSIFRDGVRSIQARNFTPSSDRVEVLKGPASMLYGMGEPGGVINIISKKPELVQKTHIEGWGSSFKGGGGQLDVTGPLGTSGLAYRMVVDHDETDYWRNFGRNRQTTIAPSLMWYGEDTTVRVSYEHMEYLTPFDRGTIIDPKTGKPVNTPRDRRFDESYNATRGDQDSVTMQVDRNLNDRWKSSLTYSYNRNRYSDNQARAMSYDSNTGILTRRADSTGYAHAQAQIAQLTLNGDIDWGRINHQLLFGFDYEADRTFRGDMIRSANNTTDFNIYNPIYGQLQVPKVANASDSDQRENIDSKAFFMQDAIRLNDRWQLLGGLRYDTFDVMSGKGRPFVTRTDSTYSRVVPRAGIIYNLTSYSSLYASYSESFKPNSSIAAQATSLPPELGRSYEIGAKWDLDNRISGNLALFDIEKRNVMVTERIGSENFGRVVGQVRSQGAELDLAGKLTDSLSLIGSYAYTDARVTADPKNNGKRMPNSARHTASLFLTQDFGNIGLAAGDDLRAGAGARYVSRRAGKDDNNFYLDAYTVADAFIAYSLPLNGYKVKWQLNVKNLFDQTYYPSSGNDNMRVAIGEPRQVVLRASVDF